MTAESTPHETSDLPPRREKREHRIVHDEEGHVWRVREVRFADAKPSLIFESEVSFRRVRGYPENWFLLTDEELFALSWKT